MKRKLSLILLVMMLFTSMALAEGVEWTTYTHPDDGYKIDYPSDWTATDKDTINEIWDNVVAGKVKGINVSMLESSEELIRNGGLAMFVSPGSEVNFNVQYQDVGRELATQDLVEALCPSMIEYFQTAFTDMQVLVPGDMMVAGDVEYAYVLIQCTANGEQTMVSQTYTMFGTKVYIITYTLFPERDMDISEADALTQVIAASFVPSAGS